MLIFLSLLGAQFLSERSTKAVIKRPRFSFFGTQQMQHGRWENQLVRYEIHGQPFLTMDDVSVGTGCKWPEILHRSFIGRATCFADIYL